MPRRLLLSGVKRSSKKSDKYFFNIQLIFISLIYIKCILRAEKVFCTRYQRMKEEISMDIMEPEIDVLYGDFGGMPVETVEEN